MINKIALYFLAIILFTVSGKSTFAQSFDNYYNEGLRLEAIPDEKNALIQFQMALKASPYNLKALYKCSELCARIGSRETKTSDRERYYHSALTLAKVAMKYYPKTDDANVAMSIAMGKIALTKSGKDKISYVKDIKFYADAAIKINPNNFKAWHIIGKWNYEVANLTFLEEAAVKLLFGGLPNASFTDAINAFEKAKSINPKFCLNYLELAKSYKKAGNTAAAISLLQQLITLPNSNEDDPIIKREAKSLIQSWN